MTTDLAQLSTPSSIGWYGAATTYCQIDPRERLVAVAFARHFLFNQQNFFAAFQTGSYQALKIAGRSAAPELAMQQMHDGVNSTANSVE